MSKVEKHQVPKIRFQGFLNSWEKSSLDSYVKVVSGGTPDTKIKEYWGGDINWFAPAEIGNQRYVFSSERKITETGLKSSSAKLLPAHKTVLFTSRAGIGSMALLSVEACTNQGFQSLVVNTDKAETYFIYSMGKIITQSALKIASGSTFLEISGKALAGLQFNFPKIEEQTQIGNFFQQLDKLIELQTRSVESAETYKKAMLQKMFPQKGEKVPRVRFEGFSGDWNESKLGELVSFSKGKGYSKSSLVDKGDPIILYGGLYTDYKSNINNVTTFAIPLKNSVYTEGDEIILPSSGESDVDIARASAVTQKGVLLGGDLNVLKPKKDFNNIFMALNLTYSSVNSSLVKRAQGQVVVHLYNSDIQNLKISFPTLEEQNQIGNFFQKIDQNIESEKKKLEQYQTMKRAMLQRMFV